MHKVVHNPGYFAANYRQKRMKRMNLVVQNVLKGNLCFGGNEKKKPDRMT